MWTNNRIRPLYQPMLMDRRWTSLRNHQRMLSERKCFQAMRHLIRSLAVSSIAIHLIIIFFLPFLKFSNKSDGHSAALTIEKPADYTSANQRKSQSSTETRTNAECDKSSKSSPASSEWVKNVQTNTRSSVENENTGTKLHDQDHAIC